MAHRLEGKTALITAAGQGIGRAAALAMAREGARVIATDVNPKLLETFAGVAGVTTRMLDVLDDAAIRDTFAELPPLSVLFNCAGYVHNGTILDCTPRDWDFSFNLNVRAMYMTIQLRAADDARERRWQHHQHGFRRGVDQGHSQSLRLRREQGRGRRPHQGGRGRFRHQGHSLQCGRAGHGRYAIAARSHQRLSPTPIEARKNFIARQPMGRLAKPEEIAPVIVFLASDESAFATGNVYSVDGGMTI